MDFAQQGLRALTLAERGRTRDDKGSIVEETQSPLAIKWASQPPFDGDLPFSERLAADGLSESQFASLLNEKTADLAARFPEVPDWVKIVCEAFSGAPLTSNIAWPGGVTSHDMYGFLQGMEHLIVPYLDRIKTGVLALGEAFDELPFDAGTVEEILLTPVPENIFRMASRTLILELNVARVRGQLDGDTPEARYRQFFERLTEPEVLLTFFTEYTVLARQLVIYLGDWQESSLEFLRRLCTDWDAIRAQFASSGTPGKLVRFDSGLGDRHNRGRTVGIAHFASGFRVVYKPRSQKVTSHFQDLLAWLNTHGLPFQFRTMSLLDREDYGWMEFVDSETCQTAEQVERFYLRQGGYLTLLYILSGTDVHAENLVASGEHPLLIDVETLFHPLPKDRVFPQWLKPVAVAMQESVMRSLLLPVRILANDEQEGIDFSGLGAQAGQMYPTPVPYLEDPKTDKMRIAHKRVQMAGALNRPTLNGQDVDVAQYLDSVVTGFETVYRFLWEHRTEFLSKTGPLAPFAADPVRIILRATRTYAGLVQEAFHPNLLRNALHRDRLFDYLWRQVPHQPTLRSVIASEKEDLHRGNIPFFLSRPDSCDLWDSSGKRLPNFFPETSLAYVRQRVETLNERDLEAQLWLIRASFLALPNPPHRPAAATTKIGSTRAMPSSSAEKLDHKRLLDTAKAAGDRIEALALHAGDHVGWIGLTPGGQSSSFLITPAGLDLYDGLPGIALFLAYLGDITGEQRYSTLAEKVLVTIRSQLEETRTEFKSIGAFTGWGGLLYLYTHLATLWGGEDLFEAADQVVEEISKRVDQDERLDVIGGAAGCIATLIGLHRVSASSKALETAVQCGDHLMTTAKSFANGTGWLTTVGATRPVTGFSHGAAGMAWALSTLARVSGEQRFGAMAESTMAYERSAFSEQTRNWRSLRSDEVEGEDKVAWCYGAPGIGLARLNSPQTDPRFEMEIEASVQTTLEHLPGQNHSLCHGDLGNLELVLQASQRPGGTAWQPGLNLAVHAVLDAIDRHGWVGGTMFVTAPGLMTGIAGIGYQLLRLAEPSRVPSILTLAPPAKTERFPAGNLT